METYGELPIATPTVSPGMGQEDDKGPDDSDPSTNIPPKSAVESSERKLLLFEDDMSVVYGGEKYTLRRGQYFEALIFMARQHRSGNPWVGKNAVFNSCNIGARKAMSMSVVKWFRESKGEARRFAEQGLIENDGRGNCRITVKADLIEIKPYLEMEESEA